MSHCDRLEEAVRATTIHSPTSFSWMGERSPRLTPGVRRALTPLTTRAYLLSAIRTRLYRSFYRLGGARPQTETEPWAALGGLTPFVEELITANRGRGFVDDGWLIRRIGVETVTAEKHGLQIRVPLADCVTPNGTAVAEGSAVGFHHPNGLLTRSPGFYSVFGDRPFPPPGTVPVVRLYWHLAGEGAAEFVAIASRLLNEAQLPFRFKILSDPGGYIRCDAAVMYLPGERFHKAAPLVVSIYERIAGATRPATPVFTKPLAPGLGLAEDPPGGHSFGLHRCHLVAEGLMRAHAKGIPTLEGRLDEVVACLAEAGIDMGAPYLNPGSTDDYLLPRIGASTSAFRTRDATGRDGQRGAEVPRP